MLLDHLNELSLSTKMASDTLIILMMPLTEYIVTVQPHN